MREATYQKHVIDKVRVMLPGAYVYPNDGGYIQGFPDITILYKKRWATLECKRDKDSEHQPNQDYYVSDMKKQSFSAFIFPENEKEVLDELQRALKPTRRARVSKS
jgi:hypothetical protein